MKRRAAMLAAFAVPAAAIVWLLAREDDDRSRAVRQPGGPPPRVEATRDCETHIEGRLPPADARDDLIAGPIRFHGFRQTSRFATRERGPGFFERRHGEYGGVKFVTEVKAGAEVIVAIAPGSRGTAGLLYGQNIRYGRFGIPFEEAERAVRFRGCPAGHPAFSPRHYGRRTVGPWTQFNGGFLFTEAQCLGLDVYVRGAVARRFVEPFGRPRAACA